MQFGLSSIRLMSLLLLLLLLSLSTFNVVDFGRVIRDVCTSFFRAGLQLKNGRIVGRNGNIGRGNGLGIDPHILPPGNA